MIEPTRSTCAYCLRPVWDETYALTLTDPASLALVLVHRGCERRRARVERELDATVRRTARPTSP